MKDDLSELANALMVKAAQRQQQIEQQKQNPKVTTTYAPQSSPVIRNLTDMMNKKWYNAYYTQSYAPVPEGYLQHQYVKIGPVGNQQYVDFGPVAPIFTPTKGTERAYGALTIAGMIDLLDQHDDFELANPNDMIEIRSVCENYYNEVLKNHSRSRTAKNYGDKVQGFIKLLDSRIRRLPGKHRELSYEDLLKLMGM